MAMLIKEGWPSYGIKEGGGIVAMLRHKGRWGIVTMLRHKGRWWDNGHVKA